MHSPAFSLAIYGMWQKKSDIKSKRSKSLRILIFAALWALGGCDQKSSSAKSDEKPAVKVEVDPTEQSNGVLERLATPAKGTRYINRINESDTAGQSPLKVSAPGKEYLFFDKYGADTLRVAWKGNEEAKPRAVILQMDSSDTRMYIPLGSQDFDKKSGTIKVPLHPDSSLLPGIFELEANVEDEHGRLSKSIRKWVIVGGRKVDIQEKLPGAWRIIRHTGLGRLRHRGHFLQFDAQGRSGEWMDFSMETNPQVRSSWVLSHLFSQSRQLAPNWDYQHTIDGDKVRFKAGAGYRILGLSDTRLVIREFMGGGNRFGVFERWGGSPHPHASAKAASQAKAPSHSKSSTPLHKANPAGSGYDQENLH